MPFLFAKDISTQEFISFVNNGQWPETSLLMAFSPDSFKFETLDSDKIIPADTEEGRIFWPEGELKWRKMEQGMRVVYLGDNTPPLGLDNYSSEMDGLNREKGKFFLWGIRTDTDDEWIEQQVPHRFVYPVSEKEFSRGRVKLIVEKWVDNSGFARFSRYHSLEECEGGE
ncbi:CRISPR-associated protein Csx19 [Desulfobacterales bacterium HSG17]|nr:CRISPR-associated protein Csx19 [Desulfobacterales bacterium HSG17]